MSKFNSRFLAVCGAFLSFTNIISYNDTTAIIAGMFLCSSFICDGLEKMK